MRKAAVDSAIHAFESYVQLFVGIRARSCLFVHAGVVGWKGAAMLIPGPSGSGKTELVAELLRGGATFFSDEFAVLDEEGLVHPYPRPLHLRRSNGRLRCYADEFGSRTATEPRPVRLVVHAGFRPAAVWLPKVLSPRGALEMLLANTPAAGFQPKMALRTLAAVLRTAVAIRGDRGEATTVARRLLSFMDEPHRILSLGRELPPERMFEAVEMRGGDAEI